MTAEKTGQFFTGTLFTAILTALACAVPIFGMEVLGALVFFAVICGMLLLCDDISATTLPFLLMSVFLSSCYDSYDTFIRFWWLVFPLAFSLIFHFVRFRKKIRIGKSFWGITAVALAVTLGGIGTISAKEYFSATSLYYVGMLGIGMVVAYLLMKSQLVEKKYDVREKFVTAMELMGLFTLLVASCAVYDSFLVCRNELEYPVVTSVQVAVSRLNSKANYCTFLMLAMPFTVYRAHKNKLHLLVTAALYAGTVGLGSRAGILLGSALLLICLIYGAVSDKKYGYAYLLFLLAALGAGAGVAVYALQGRSVAEEGPLKYILWRFRYGFISKDDSRIQLMKRAWENFLKNPLFGHGLGYCGNADLYSPKTGAMQWYHMMIPQVMGSMGIFGILAYGYQIVNRAALCLKNRSALRWAMALSYLGILMMSQVNPGEFCPIPYELITVMLFLYMEYDDEKGLA